MTEVFHTKIGHKQLSSKSTVTLLGLGKANVVAWARQDFKLSKAVNCSVDISMGPFCPPVRGVRDAATSAQFGAKRR